MSKLLLLYSVVMWLVGCECCWIYNVFVLSMVVVLASNYACPLCCHSTVDMTNQWQFLDEEVAATQMPDEYRDVTVWVLCRDCHKVPSVRLIMMTMVNLLSMLHRWYVECTLSMWLDGQKWMERVSRVNVQCAAVSVVVCAGSHS